MAPLAMRLQRQTTFILWCATLLLWNTGYVLSCSTKRPCVGSLILQCDSAECTTGKSLGQRGGTFMTGLMPLSWNLSSPRTGLVSVRVDCYEVSLPVMFPLFCTYPFVLPFSMQS